MKNMISFLFFFSIVAFTAQATAQTELYSMNARVHEESTFQKRPEEFVTVKFLGGLGNLMFEAAAACGCAWDHGAVPSFSAIQKMKKSYRTGVFSRFDQRFPSDTNKPAYILSEGNMKKRGSLSYVPNMQLEGYLQSVCYFEKYETELKNLFQPIEKDTRYLRSKYKKILSHPHTVGVQLRYYQDGTNLSTKFIQYGADYLKKATRLFSPDCLFVVSSNNVLFAKKNWPSEYKNVIFLDDEQDYLEMYLLSMCEHNIITNSSFGFWGAWLNRNPKKVVARPLVWIGGEKRENMTPKEWIMIDAEYNEAAKASRCPSSTQ